MVGKGATMYRLGQTSTDLQTQKYQPMRDIRSYGGEIVHAFQCW